MQKIWIFATRSTKSGKTDTKHFLFVVVTLPNENITKLVKKLEPSFKLIINLKKYSSKLTEQAWSR